MNKYHKSFVAGALALATMAPVAMAAHSNANFISAEFDWMKDLNNGLSVDDLYGGKLGLGWQFNGTENSYMEAYFNIGLLYGSDSEMNGTSSYKYKQKLIPVCFGWNYHYDLSESVSVYSGLEAGVYMSKASRDAESSNNAYFRREDYSDWTPVIGVNLGVNWSITDSWDMKVGISLHQTLMEIESSHFFRGRDIITQKDCATSASLNIGFSYKY